MRHRGLHRLTCSLAALALVALGSGGEAQAATVPDPATETSATQTSATPALAADSGDRRPARGEYAALGDSYSAGEGTGVYDPATDTAANRCHRSPLAYPALLSRDRRLRPLRFVACSGATTADLYAANHSNPTEPAQLAALSRRTRAVSLTLGGNDVGFGTVLAACIRASSAGGFGCSTSPQLNAAVQGWTATLAGQARVPGPGGLTITPMRQVLADIAAAAPNARIYLAGYPELWGDRVGDHTADPSAPSGASCVVNSAVLARMDYADAQWFNANTRRLNQVLQAAVASARQAGVRVRYVAPTRFDGHGLCDARRSWIRPLLLTPAGTPRSESFHPTGTGHRQGYRTAFRRAGL